MIITAKCGIEMFCLPDGALCKESGKSPEEMDICPIFNFDDDGYNCVPELCDSYTEKGGTV